MSNFSFKINPNLLYVVPKEAHDIKQIKDLLDQHPEVCFASLVGVDMAGNDTDEKIPISLFYKDMEDYLHGAVQTDGSSVVLPGIATLNDGKIDLVADLDVNWFIDYNYENIALETGLPRGTLRIPALLKHNQDFTCSRSILRKACQYFSDNIKQLLDHEKDFAKKHHLNSENIDEIEITIATELEFWVRTPDDVITRDHLSTSQDLKEQYWKRTKGIVRTALEQSIELLRLYGFKPEMGHKEVGGVKAHLNGRGDLDHILEQLEIDWRFDTSIQAADNELFARIIIKEVFRLYGLEASFLAKPIDGVAGSGEHLHVNATAKLKDGKRINLFAPTDYNHDFLSEIGWGAVMGMIKHYPAINAFVTATTDAFKRLQPGFEAPTHPVISLGNSYTLPSRNRTVLAGIIRSETSQLATRFELRSPNPHTNVYLAISAICQFMLDGIHYAVKQKKTTQELERELCKAYGDPADYLEKNKMYRSEDDIFVTYSKEERDKLFGTPANGVYDCLKSLMTNTEALTILNAGNVFSDLIIRSYAKAMFDLWELELRDRELSINLMRIRNYKEIPFESEYDKKTWQKIHALKCKLAKNDEANPCLFQKIRDALACKNMREASLLQIEMDQLIRELDDLYDDYKKNHLNI